MIQEIIKNPNWSLAILMICAVTSMTQNDFAKASGIYPSVVSGLIHESRGVRLSYVTGKKIEVYARKYLSEDQVKEVNLDNQDYPIPSKYIRNLSGIDRSGMTHQTVTYGTTSISVCEDCMWDLGLQVDQDISKSVLVAIHDWAEGNKGIPSETPS